MSELDNKLNNLMVAVCNQVMELIENERLISIEKLDSDFQIGYTMGLSTAYRLTRELKDGIEKPQSGERGLGD